MEPIFLGTEQDKTGIDVQIMRLDQINDSRSLFSFFLKNMAELIESGFAFPRTQWKDDDLGAIFATIDGKIVGHIVYSTEKIYPGGFLWITLSAVDKKFRGRGIYSVMHPYFETRSKELGCWAIASNVHPDNSVRLKSCAQVGMKQIFYCMGKKLNI